MHTEPENQGSLSNGENRGWGSVTWLWFRQPPEVIACFVYVSLIILSIFGFLFAVGAVGTSLTYLAVSMFSGGPESPEAARNLIVVVGGLISVPFFIWRAYVGHWQAKTAAENYTTGLIARAIEQLGTTREVKSALPTPSGADHEVKYTLDAKIETVPNLEIRIGAIQILKRIAEDSPRDRASIFDILSTYIRAITSDEVARFKDAVETDESGVFEFEVVREHSWTRSRQDVIAAIKAIIVLIRKFGSEEKIDLSYSLFSGIDLSNITISGIDFTGSIFINTRFSLSIFFDIVILNCDLYGVHFDGADLRGISNINIRHCSETYFDERTIPPEGFEIVRFGDGQVDGYCIRQVTS